MTTMSKVPDDHPLMIAWNEYKAGPDFENTKQWATAPKYTEGSLWAAFMAGWYKAVALQAQQPAAPSGAVNVVGMPEFDSLLDHIYEHGTAAEGVIEKANAFARAVIARYAPQQPAAVDAAREATKESKR